METGERKGSTGFVLVHGGGMGPWIWEGLRPHLDLPAHAVLDEPACLAFERVSRRGMPPVPRTYVRLLADRTASVETQDRMAANLGEAAVRSVDADHMVMLSRPEALAQVLNHVAASVAGTRAAAATGRGEG